MFTTCTIHDSNNRALATGTVRAHEGDTCQIFIVNAASKPDLPEPGEDVTLHLCNDMQGIRIFRATAETVKFSMISFTGMEHVRTIQRRNDVKVKLSMKLQIYPQIYIAQEDDEDAKIPVPDTENPIPIDMADISAGGIGFYCDQPLNHDKTPFFYVRIDLPDRCAELRFVIVRTVDHGQGKYFYGCRFHRIPPPEESALRSYIFKRGLYQ